MRHTPGKPVLKKRMRRVARVLIIALAYQLLYPNITMALTSGPSQPEVQSFEPVGTTDMVDLFSGDFVYNIPLLDIEGYPVNISYHGGVGMEQEASWVGLGWNINPGVINRSVRGIPDDFDGDSLHKQLNIKPEKTVRIGTGIGPEIVGLGDPLVNISLGLGTNINISNYRGVGVDFSFSAGVSLFRCVSAGVNVGVGSQTGAEIDYNAGLQLSTSQIVSSDMSGGIGVSYGHGYSTRSGLKDASFTISTSVTAKNTTISGPSFGGAIPIALKNYVPVITNSSTMRSIYARIKLGGELAWCNLYGNISCMVSNVKYDANGSRKSYGYLYYQDALPDHDAILDFTRDRDGMFNKTMQYLPPGNMTYDVYSVNGQGTGGMFRPFRNDFGAVYDPNVGSSNSSTSVQLEANLGWLFSIGADVSATGTEIHSGPWGNYNPPFNTNKDGSIYENVYFKQGGELTSVDTEYYQLLNGLSPIKGNATVNFSDKPGSDSHRDPRANLVSYFNGDEASEYGVASSRQIYSYDTSGGFGSGPIKPTDTFARSLTGEYQRKGYHISEMVQTQTDGKRYIFGIPAMNNVSREVTFAINGPSGEDLQKGLVAYNDGDDSPGNNNGIDHYFSSTVTPAYAHSYLLTSVLSPDYTDVTGNGPTDDDMGSYTKFNYSLKNDDYRWRAPIDTGKAQYNPGYKSDKQDDKANYLIGSREQWMLHSIESKNFIAEFYTSARNDGKGVTSKIKDAAGYDSDLGQAGNSYKLDSIKLYNKHDRYLNTTKAVPVKTVIFQYDYSLCANTPNSVASGGGKLTLKRIYFRYGNSDKSMTSPYRFEYFSDENPTYSIADKDRWGNYKPNDPSLPNYDFPFVKQDSVTDDYAKAWSLKKIILPSGGSIEVDYESDDYAYVQNKIAMEMFKAEGLGNSENYTTNDQLYSDKDAPNLYVYFKRRPNDELDLTTFKEKYLKGSDCLYFNFNIDLRDGHYEQVKGYADIEKAGICPNNSTYGYIKMKAVKPNGKATAHPASYTALNIGRYNLPHILFPGADPDQSDIQNILAGLKQSFTELVSIGVNPIVTLLKAGRAKQTRLSKCYIRLNDPALKKKGGGQRVKSMTFSDSWASQSGGSNATATYGKNYDYTIKEDGFGIISSGVASYEPLVGGDENPFRVPVKFTVQNGSKWPPNDPVDLYQETPVAESLLPSAQVGYRKVTVTSIHKDEGRSSQGIDVYQFYTAKDYPFEVKSTDIEKLTDDNDFSLFEQKNILEATQGYTVILNDMHGKPKSIEHYVYKPKGGNQERISSQTFKYYESGGKLNNYVQGLVYKNGGMLKKQMQLGVEMDLTIDSREKTEETNNFSVNVNVNATNIAFVLVPIPLGFPWEGHYHNEFRSVVATKIVQQYGILKDVTSFNEGAVTIMTNEVFDPVSGQPVVTSVNNEFNDLEYNVNYPAYWGVKGMGPAYGNIGYTDKLDSAYINQYTAYLKGLNPRNYRVGDELFMTYKNTNPADTSWYSANVWVVGFYGTTEDPCCYPIARPRYPSNTPGWDSAGGIKNIHLKIVRSGCKNQLNESMQSYTTMQLPFSSSGYLKDTLTQLISLKGAIYADTVTRNIPGQNQTNTLNEFPKGEKGQYRMIKEYAYMTDRTYSNNAVRKTGLFNAYSLWNIISSYQSACATYPDMKDCSSESSELIASYMLPHGASNDNNWKLARAVTAWSPFGAELENRDAVGNYSTAVYGYNEDLPTAVAFNARQGQVLAEGFEDFRLLNVASNLMQFLYSPFKSLFSLQSVDSSYKKYSLTSGSNSIVKNIAHTGQYSFKTGSTLAVSIPVGDPYTIYRPFTVQAKQKYLLSFWVRPVTINGVEMTYPGSPTLNIVSSGTNNFSGAYTTNIIEKWQKVECVFTPDSGVSNITMNLPSNYYFDDIRIFPYDANMKSFVYNPSNEKLMATLDENNFATFYEYDQEGNLVRTKKETEKGIMTISESRSAHPKHP